MTTSVILAPYPRWSARNLVGDAAIGAFLFTYENQTQTPKATYADPGARILNPNPLQLDGKGEANIYWATDDYYSIALYANVGGIPGGLILTQDNYPVVTSGGSSPPITVNEIPYNFVRNPQFYSWHQNTNNLIDSNQVEYQNLQANDNICDDWVFDTDVFTANNIVQRMRFFPGQSDVPVNPTFWMNFTCDSVGSGGETRKNIYQSYESVQTLQNTEVTVAFWAKSSSSSTITVNLSQNFGTGGTPSDEVETAVVTTTLTPTWQQITGTVTLPSISGQILGTNGDDALALVFALPLNQLCSIDICNVQINASNSLIDFQQQSNNDQLKNLMERIYYPAFKTGDIKTSLSNATEVGWVLMDDHAIGNSASNAPHAGNQYLKLFNLIWNNVSNNYAPLLNSDGDFIDRGDSSMDDWNANNRITLTRSLGRYLAAAGAGAGLSTYALGQFGGNEDVDIEVTNLPPHRHEYSGADNDASGASGSGRHPVGSYPNAFNFNTSNGSENGLNGDPVNILNPYVRVNYYIKT